MMNTYVNVLNRFVAAFCLLILLLSRSVHGGIPYLSCILCVVKTGKRTSFTSLLHCLGVYGMFLHSTHFMRSTTHISLCYRTSLALKTDSPFIATAGDVIHHIQEFPVASASPARPVILKQEAVEYFNWYRMSLAGAVKPGRLWVWTSRLDIMMANKDERLRMR